MKIIERYLIRRFLSPFLYCLAAFSLLFVIGDLFENLDTFLGIPRWGAVAVKYYILLIPTVLTMITAFAVLLALLYSLGQMQRHNEITAMMAGGVSFGRIASPVLGASLVLALLVFGSNEIIVPRATEEMELLRNHQLRGEHHLKRHLRDIALPHPPTNRSYYFESFDLREKIIQGVNIYQTDEGGRLAKKITAETAAWTGQDWRLENVRVQEFHPDRPPTASRMESKTVELGVKPPDLRTGHQELAGIGLGELRRQLITRQEFPDAALRPLRVEIHQRFALPMACVIMGLIGVAFGLKLGKAGMLAGMGISLALGFLYYILYSFLTALGRQGMLPPWLSVWAVNLAFGTAGIVIMARRS